MARRGRRLTVLTEAQKHQGLVLGVGLLALAGIAAWIARDQLAQVARPRLKRTLRPLVVGAAVSRPAQAVRLIARHPDKALKLARALR